MRLLWAVLLVVLPLAAEFATAQKCSGEPDAPEHAAIRCFKKRGTCRATCGAGYSFPSKGGKTAIYECDGGNWVMKGGEDRCTPLCDPSCDNGECIEPDVCECDDGFTGDYCDIEEEVSEEYEEDPMEPTEAPEAYEDEDEEEYGDDYEEEEEEEEYEEDGEEHEVVDSTDEPAEEDDHDHDDDGEADHDHAEHADHGPLDDDHDHDADGEPDHEHAEHADHGPLGVEDEDVNVDDEVPEAEPTAAEVDVAETDDVETVDDDSAAEDGGEDGAETAAYGGVSEVVPKILVGSAALLIVRAL